MQRPFFNKRERKKRYEHTVWSRLLSGALAADVGRRMAQLMQEMGVQVVRMAEFSWSHLEPEEGRFTFEWLDQAIELLARHGIRSVLGTPSAAPPAWIIEKNPEIQPVDSEGRRRYFGGRRSSLSVQSRISGAYPAVCDRFCKTFPAPIRT